MITRLPVNTIRFSSFGMLLSILIALSGSASHLPAQGQKQSKDKGGQKHIFSGPPPAHPFDVILARPTDHSVTVSVLAYVDLEGFLTYGTDKGQLQQKTDVKSLKPDTPAEFVLSNLKSDTRYYYQLHTRELKKPEFTAEAEMAFHTQRKVGELFRFTVQSDSHLDQSTRTSVYERTLANALADQPDFHIDVGDTFMTDKYPKYQDSLPQYMAQRYYLSQLAKSAPLFLVLGNHDGERLDRYDGTAENMPVWSCLLRKKLFPNPYPDGFYTGNTTEIKHVGRAENYYAWEWGNALFIALDPFWYSNSRGAKKAEGNWSRTLGDAQFKWLEKTLATSKAKFKFVFIHHLVGGLDDSGRGGSEAATLYEWGGNNKDGKDEFASKRPGWSMPIHQLLVKHKVSVVFHGHDHFYAKQDLDDVVYLMVPQPGHPGFDRLKNAHEYGYIRGEFQSPAGHIRVSVSANQATVDYVRAYLPSAETPQRKNGEVSHSFKIVK